MREKYKGERNIMNRKFKRFLTSLLSLAVVASSGIGPVKAVDNTPKLDSKVYINSDNVLTKDFEGFGVQWDLVIYLITLMNNGHLFMKKQAF